MKTKYIFKRLIKKHQHGRLYYIQKKGFFDQNNSGKWTETEEEIKELESFALLPLGQNDKIFGDGGSYSVHDRKLYCYIPMPDEATVKLKKDNGLVEYYSPTGYKDYSDFGEGMYIYRLERSGKNE